MSKLLEVQAGGLFNLFFWRAGLTVYSRSCKAELLLPCPPISSECTKQEIKSIHSFANVARKLLKVTCEKLHDSL